MKVRFSRRQSLLPTLMVLLCSACSARGCGRTAITHEDSGTLMTAGPDVAPDAEILVWNPGDLPGKGWHCYPLVGHFGDPPRFVDGSYCARSVEDCLRKMPSTMDIRALNREEECAKLQERAYCYKEQWKWDRITKIHCFQEMRECKRDRSMSCGCSDPVTECREFE